MLFSNGYKNLSMSRNYLIRPDSYPNSTGPSASYTYGNYKDETSVGADDGTGLFKDHVMDLLQPWFDLMDKHSITPSNAAEVAGTSQIIEALTAELKLAAGNVDIVTVSGNYMVTSDNKNGVLLLDGTAAAITLLTGAGVDDGNRLTIINNTGAQSIITAALAITIENGEKLLLFYDSDISGWNFILSDTVLSGIFRNLEIQDATSLTTGSFRTLGGMSVTKAIYAGGKITTDDVTDSTSGTTGSIQTDGGIAAVKKIYSGETVLAVGGTKRGSGSGSEFNKEITLPIGDWDMDVDGVITLSHSLGSDWSKIKSVQALIFNDSNNVLFNLSRVDTTGSIMGGWDFIDSTNIGLKRTVGGSFDNSGFSTPPAGNRGWLFITFEA